MNTRTLKQYALAICLTAAAMMTGAGRARAEDAPTKEQLLNRITALEKRRDEKEMAGTNAPPGTKTGHLFEADADSFKAKMAEYFGKVHFSGFASASYLYNFNRPGNLTPSVGGVGGGGGGATDYTRGRSFDGAHNEFAINKLKLVLEKPVDYSATNWDAGFRADLIFGQDAALIQSSGLALGSHGDLEQLYATVNVPVGHGLQVCVGKMVTLMGVEVIEETVNPNWSEGNQFLFVENFTGTGVQLAYKWTDKIDTQFRVLNGWDVVKDNNDALSYMGRIGFAPDDKTSIGLVGYAGPEQTGNESAWRKGINLVASRKLTPKLTAWVQGDYGEEDASAQLAAATGNAALATKSASWWAGGLWLTYDFTEKVGVALRGDYLKDKDGARTSGAPLTAPFPANNGQDLSSFTATLNLKPYKNLQVRPELRWDHSSGGLFGSHNNDVGRNSQVTASVGVAYLF
ncbi:MAG: porin [Verrucomicrobiota bacterium]